MRGEVAREAGALGSLASGTEGRGGSVLVGARRGGDLRKGHDEIGDKRVGTPGGEGRDRHAGRDAAEVVAAGAAIAEGMREIIDLETPSRGKGGVTGGEGGGGGGRGAAEEQTVKNRKGGGTRQLVDGERDDGSGGVGGGGRGGESSNDDAWTVLAPSGWRADEIEALLEVSEGTHYTKRFTSPPGGCPRRLQTSRTLRHMAHGREARTQCMRGTRKHAGATEKDAGGPPGSIACRLASANRSPPCLLALGHRLRRRGGGGKRNQKNVRGSAASVLWTDAPRTLRLPLWGGFSQRLPDETSYFSSVG